MKVQLPRRLPLITTEAMVAELPKKQAPAMPAGGGGMGGMDFRLVEKSAYGRASTSPATTRHAGDEAK
jgi:hypothetical protein